MDIILATNPLEEALNKLDLQGTLVLMNLLCQRSLWLQQEDVRKGTKVKSIITSNEGPKILKGLSNSYA